MVYALLTLVIVLLTETTPGKNITERNEVA